MSATTTTPHTPWPTVKLGDVCEISRGRVMSKKYLAEHFGKYPVYSSQTKNEGVFGYIDTYDFDGEYLTWTTDGANAGSVFYHNGKFSITNVCGLLRVINNSIDARWLLQYLRTYAKSYVNKSMGNPKLMSNVVARIPIPLPSLDIQREIVAKVEAGLKEADALAAHFKRLAALADETFKAELDETFGTLKEAPKVRLGDLGQMTRGRGIKKSDVISGGKPCIRYGEIYTSFNFILDAPRSFVSDEIYENSVRIKTGDLVFTLTGENREEIAKTIAYLGEDEIAAGGDLAVWSNHRCNPKYLSYLMYSSPLIHEKAIASNGQIIVHASVKKLQNISIPLPSLDIQREIVAKLEAVKARCEWLKAEAERGLKAAEALRKAVLAEAFEQ